MTEHRKQWDQRSVQSLRSGGSLKWTGFPDAMGAWVAEMDFGLAAPIRTALEEYASSELTGYAPPWLEHELARATNDYYSTNFGWAPGVQNIVPIGDVLAGLGGVLDYFLDPAAPVVLPTPAYMPFLKFPRLRQRRVIEVPMLRDEHGWHMDLAAIDTALAPAGGLVILCNPHNPVGKMYSRTELEELSAIVARHDARVFSDEIHASISFDGRDHLPYASVNSAAARQAITATAASKTFNIPGLKCAQLIFSNPQDLERWQEYGFFISHGASLPGMRATVAAYDHGAAWRDEVLQYLQGNRDLLGQLLSEQLPGIDWLAPQGTYLAWLNTSGLSLPPNAQQFMLQQAQVAVVDGAECGSGLEGFLRMNFAMPRPLLIQTVQQMADAVARR